MDTIKGSPARNVHPLQPTPPRPAQRSWIWPWLIRLPLLGATAVVLLIFLAMIFVAAHQMQYDGLIFPGVSAYGVKLSGMTKDQAFAALSERYTYGTNAVFTFRDRDKAWRMTAQELGVQFDPLQTVEEAFKVGRAADLVGNLAAQAEAWTNGRSLQPVVVFDQSKAQSFLEQIGAEINKPVMDATISLNKTVVKTTPSQIGRDLDIPATLGLLRPVVLNMGTGGEINLIVRETQPAIADAEGRSSETARSG